MAEPSITIFTCDSYSHIVPLTIKYLDRAWSNHPRVEIVTNTIPIESKYPVIYLGKDKGWCSNILAYVKDKTDPFILLCEEGILTEVDESLLQKAFDAWTPDLGLLRLFPCPGPTLPWSEDIGEIDKALPYAISVQMSIWNPQTIRDIARPGETPWDFEIQGSQRALNYTPKFLGTYHSALSYKEYTRRGKLNPDALKWIANHP